MMRRNEFTFGANSAIADGRYFCSPAMCAKNSGLGLPSWSLNTFLPVFASTTLWWMCMALPGSRAIGFDMNVAYILWRNAASRAVRLNMNTWSASDIASPWIRLISICAAPSSWISVSISISCASQNA